MSFRDKKLTLSYLLKLKGIWMLHRTLTTADAPT